MVVLMVEKKADEWAVLRAEKKADEWAVLKVAL